MKTRHILTTLAAIALVTSVLPAATASHHVYPPDGTGFGAGDVGDEPNHPDDANMIPNQGFSPDSPTLIYEGMYNPGTPYPLWYDLDNTVNVLVHGDHYESYQHHMYPGFGFYSAWWGWWQDKGSGGYTNEETALLNNGPDGSIQDAHDNPEETAYHGPWDEFCWRGINPWADANALCPAGSFPADQMYVFVQPGTHEIVFTSDMVGLGVPLGNQSDGAQTPDFLLEDRTNQAAASPGPVPHNGAAYGWLSDFGWSHINYDASLLISTTATFAVNPKSTGGATYDPYQAGTPGAGPTDNGTFARDVDAYTAIHPAVETLYRTAIWDPGNEQSSPGDFVHDEGPKQLVKENVPPVYDTTVDTVNDLLDALLEPVVPTQGKADDLVFKARPHEPDTGEEDYDADGDGIGAGVATHDSTTSYGGLAGDYYQPGPDQNYSAFASGEYVWFDAQGQMAYEPQYLVQIRDTAGENIFLGSTSDPLDGSYRSTGPGFFMLEGFAGSWYDTTGDTWIGNLEEAGRSTSADDPYQSGNVDDPNDYGDHAAAHVTDPAKAGWEYEWRGLCTTGQEVTATIEPANGNSWGALGVYVVRDHDDKAFNPYDDAVEDALGLDENLVGGIGKDHNGDGTTLGQHRTSGPISFEMQCGADPDVGRVWSNENVILPLGTFEVPVKITATFTVSSSADDLGRGDTATVPLAGQSVTDIDYIGQP